MKNQLTSTRAAAILAAAAALSSAAQAQSLVLANPNVIATNDDLAPGSTGSVFGGSGNFDSAVIDESGNVLFRARMVAGTAGPTTDRAYFSGSTRANLAMVIRSGDAAPGLPGLTLNTATGTGPGGSPRIAGNGLMLWGSSLQITPTTDDTALFIGTPGNFQVLVREGAPAVGTVGAVYSQSFSNPSYQPSGLNNAGRVLFQASLSGGDVIPSPSNNAAWYSGSASGLELVQRKGDVVLGGAVISSLGFISQINASGQVLHDEQLSTTLGTLPATAANDRTLWLWTPGVGNTLLVREGDPAPGTSGGTFSVASNSWFVNVTSNCFNNAGQALMVASLSGGDVVGTTNDVGLYIVSTAGQTLAVRKGDPAPGLSGGETLNGFSNSNTTINNAGRIAFKSLLTGPTVTTGSDEAVYAGLPGALQLIMREGDPAPGTNGAVFASFLSQGNFHQNELGQVTFQADLALGDVIPGTNDGAIYAWDPNTGLHLVVRKGDSIEVQPGVFKAPFTYGGVQFNNGDANPLSFNKNGLMALRLNFPDSTAAILTVQVPTLTAPLNYCSTSTTSVGCNPAISASANPNVAHSAPVNIAVSNLEGQKSGLIFYGITGRVAANWCAGGTSTLCVKAPTQRTTLQSTAGTNGVCDGALSLDWSAFMLANPAALGNPFSAGTVVDVQGWFRDPLSCKTTNLTDAVELTYQP